MGEFVRIEIYEFFVITFLSSANVFEVNAIFPETNSLKTSAADELKNLIKWKL